MIPILLVDDNPTNLKVFSANLSGLNYQLLTATTGERALVVAENALPELIFVRHQYAWYQWISSMHTT